jgi:hypothetical protein
MNARRASGPQYKYRVRARPTPHLANFHHSCALGLRRHQCPEHAATYGAPPRLLHPRSMPSLRPRRRSIASPSTSTASPGAHRRLRPRSTPSTSTNSLTPPTVRFTDAPDRVLRSTLSFLSPQVIHEELANCCRILSSSTKIELPCHSCSWPDTSAAVSKYEQLILKYDLSWVIRDSSLKSIVLLIGVCVCFFFPN